MPERCIPIIAISTILIITIGLIFYAAFTNFVI